MSRVNKFRLASVVAVVAVYGVSLAAFPEAAASWRELLVVAGFVLVGVFTVLPALLPLIWPERQRPKDHVVIQQRGEVNVAVTGDQSESGIHITTTISPIAPPLPHQLRRPPNNFTGRQSELGELLAAAEHGGVIISGMGGVGKTALALVLADKLKTTYSDAQFDIDLRGVSAQPLAPWDVMLHVIRSYDVTFKSNDDNEITGRYRSVLSGKRTVLLLDNVHNAAQIEPLIPPEGNVVIVTSRDHFTLPPLYEKRLLSLSALDARRLLLALAPGASDVATG